MFTRRTMIGWLAAEALTGMIGGIPRLAADDKAPAKEKKKAGTVVGTLTAKGDNWIEVKADGEEKGRRYVPRWIGGAPKDGGGPDKEIMPKLKKLVIGSRLRLEWEFEERARVVKIEVLKAAEKHK